MLVGKINKAPRPGLLGFDANTIITANVAQNFVSNGFSFCLRYISRGPEPSYDLSTAEAQVILNAGLALMPVQHVRAGEWVATSDLGTSDGTFAGSNAKLVGFPPGVNVWCDLEAVATTTPTGDVINYCNNWADAVSAAGYVPGLYVGYQCGLVSAQLAALHFKSFWKSQSNVPNVGGIGFQMIQLYPETPLCGIKVDVDVIQSDFKNNYLTWIETDPATLLGLPAGTLVSV